VAHALWLERSLRIGDGPWLDAAYVEGVATHPDHPRRDHGSAVMRRLQQETAGYALGALSPSRPEWYKRLGWVRRQALDHGLQSERPRAAACEARRGAAGELMRLTNPTT
jgi:predicted acetyltransferase